MYLLPVVSLRSCPGGPILAALRQEESNLQLVRNLMEEKNRFHVPLSANIFGKFNGACEDLPIRKILFNGLEEIIYALHSTEVHRNLVFSGTR